MKSQNVFFEYNGQRISYREAQVLLCCAKGMTKAQTADLLCVSYSTVKAHHEHLRTRFKLKGYHAFDCFANKLFVEFEKSVELPTEIGSSTN